ncbi:MAG: hypothetical protein ACI9FR_000351 [Cryomorphaceae bacterium]|jgi:hypothetical protein
MLMQFRSNSHLVLAFFIAVTFCSELKASSIEQIGFKAMSRSAEAVFEAEVTAVEARWDQSKTRIHTYIEFRLVDVIKQPSQGNNLQTGERLVLQFLGGKVGADELRVSGLIYPELGEKGIYFISSVTRNMVNPLIGWSQGHFKIDPQSSINTNTNSAIVAVRERSQSSATKLSNGVAAGLQVRLNVVESGSGMSKKEFKNEVLKALGR